DLLVPRHHRAAAMGRRDGVPLTASGGPFRNSTMTELQSVTVEKCLCHPNWNMGPKVTIDSSTLANKGLEVIEAHWLFSLPYDDIDVVVHPQSIVHSMIQTIDGSVIAQLGQPDMRLPIQYAFSYPARLPGHYPQLDFRQALSLTFEQPDLIRFPALKLAYEAGRQGKSYPCVFNAANEIAVQAFVAGKIPYLAIASLIEATLAAHQGMSEWSIDSVFVADTWAREQAAKSITKFSL
ncbi:MAG: 1-deoxy-D-xylulose-5-phosphate reductoisomerase, partial [Sporomusaceae bacterium]|nr:1-deoxy-D-xylulose-5-phosphate reductoisomerase [Sporomusaceae bacterium]